MAKAYIGTSGFSYPHWGNGVFYPSDLLQSDWFLYYTKQFDTVELNVSFYRLPKKEIFVGWRKKAGPKFVFSIKGSRFITHVKKLKDCREPVKRFFEAAGGLRETLVTNFSLTSARKYKNIPPGGGTSAQIRSKLSLRAPTQSDHFPPNVVLWQLPPGWRADYSRLESFLKILPKTFQHAFEFRNSTWLTVKIYELLRKYNAAVVFQDSPGWPIAQEITADFVYLRFHGKTSLYSSCYTEKDLEGWAKKIRGWIKKDLDVYAYFNNDALGYAVENAKQLKGLI